MWFVYALGSAVFAALTSILAKIGIEGVNSTLATAIRTVVVLAMSWGMVFLTRAQGGMGEISRRAVLDQYETMLKAQLLDLAAQYTIDSNQFYSMGKSTPFDGWHVTGKVVRTIYRGQTVYVEE